MLNQQQLRTLPMFFNTFSFPQVFPQCVWKSSNCVVEIPGGYCGVHVRTLVSYFHGGPTIQPTIDLRCPLVTGNTLCLVSDGNTTNLPAFAGTLNVDSVGA